MHFQASYLLLKYPSTRSQKLRRGSRFLKPCLGSLCEIQEEKLKHYVLMLQNISNSLTKATISIPNKE